MKKKESKTLAIRYSRSMSENPRPLMLPQFRAALDKITTYDWEEKDYGSGFVLHESPKQFYLTYETANGIAVHFLGDQKVQKILESVTRELRAELILM